MHDHDSQNQHQYHQSAVNRKSHLSLRKYLGYIPERLQIQISAQRIDTASRLDIITLPLLYHTVRISVFRCLLQQSSVRLKPVTGVKHLFPLIGKPQKTPAALAAGLQIRCDLLHGSILQQVIF